MDAETRSTEDLIRRHWPSMTESQRLFSQLIIDEPRIVAVNSAGALGRRLGVATSTVVRAAMALGYEGYPDLQRTVQQELFERSSLVDRLNATGRDAANAPHDIVHATFAADVEALQNTMATLPVKTFDRFVNNLIKARRIYVFGLGLSHAPAHIMATGLRQLGCDARLTTGAVSDIAEDLHGAGDEDLILAIAMARYPRRTLTALEYAEKRQLMRAAITDSAASPLASRAETVLYVRQTEFRYFQSVIPTLAIVNALLAGAAVAGGEHAHDNLAQMDIEWKDSSAFQMEDPYSGNIRKPEQP